MAVNLAGTQLVARNDKSPSKAKLAGAKKHLLCLTAQMPDPEKFLESMKSGSSTMPKLPRSFAMPKPPGSPAMPKPPGSSTMPKPPGSPAMPNHDKFVESIKSLSSAALDVSHVKADFWKPQEVVNTIRRHNPDVLLLVLPFFTYNFGALYDYMGDLNTPIILLSISPEMVMIDANLAAALRGNGANVKLTISEEQALEAVKIAVSPRILEGKRALLFGKPFESDTVPSHNLTADYVYQHTGVRVQYRPTEELIELLRGVDEASAMSEVDRWKKEASAIIKVSDKEIIDACRLYVLLHSIMEKEKFSAIALDCLSFTMSENPILPLPCLSFARLRDDGLTAACESDLCGLLSSMFMQEISRKPSFMSNVVSVNAAKSRIVLSHCVAPLKLRGADVAPMKYRLHDYHNFGRGVVPEVEFPIGDEVVSGGFSKNLKSFTLWPGRIVSQEKNTDVQNSNGPMMGIGTCANTMEVKIRDAEHFLQNIVGIHHIMVTGNHARAIENALFAMNTRMVGPSDITPPEL